VWADVIRVPFTGDAKSYSDIISTCPVPVVAAGGPTAHSLLHALEMMSGVAQAGAGGAIIGRNIWRHQDVTRVLTAFKAVIHDQMAPQTAFDLTSPSEERRSWGGRLSHRTNVMLL